VICAIRNGSLISAREWLAIDLETGQRGFVITRRQQFLEPWDAARAAFPREAEALADLVDDPIQQARIRRIIQSARAYIRDYSIPLVSAARRNRPSARSLAATAEGKRPAARQLAGT
jgi:CHASE3 domain sensor protein